MPSNTPGADRHVYFCHFDKGQLGVVLQQPNLCAVNNYTVTSTRQDETEAFFECFYKFLHGMTCLNTFSGRHVKIVLPYPLYLLVFWNLDHWRETSKKSKLLIEGITKMLDILLRNQNDLEIIGSWSWKPGLKAAKEAAKDRYRIE